MGAANRTDTLRTRAIYDKDPEGDSFVFTYRGSIIHGPTLETGNVLWTDKSYLFEYDPTEVPPALYPDWRFYKSNLYVESGRQVSSTVLNQNISLTHTFTQPGSYQVVGNTIWKDPTYAVYAPYKPGGMDYHYGQLRAEETFRVVDPMSSISIIGLAEPQANTFVTYTVSALPTGFTFMNWGIDDNNGRYGVSYDGSSFNSTVRIKFTTPSVTYGLSARFRLPDGTTRTISTPIRVGDYATTLPGPSLTSSGRLLTAGEQQWAGVPAGSKGYWVQPGQVTVSINQYDGAATYEWQTGGLTFNQLTGPYAQYTTVPPPPAGQRGKLYEIRCRATKNGQYSAWSSLWLYVSRQQPETYRAPIGVDSLQIAPKPVDVR